MRIPIALFTAAAAAFVLIGANQVLDQQRRLSAARPVAGTIVSDPQLRVVEETSSKNRRTTTYRPDVRYRYTLDDAIYTAQSVFPLSGTTSKKRGEEIVARYKKGDVVTVWYVPNKVGAPESTFLIREWDFSPYLTILGCMIFLATGLGLWVARPWRRHQPFPPKPTGDGNWRELEIARPQRARRHPWRAITLIWYVLGGVAIGHYVTNADRPYTTEALIVTPLYLALGLIPLTIYLRHLKCSRTAGDARLFINTDRIRRGKTFDVRIEQPYKKQATIVSVRLAVTCNQATSSKPLFQSWTDVKSDVPVSATRPLEARAKLTPPSDQPATVPADAPPPAHRWRITLEVRVAQCPPYTADYPITVDG
jgi:hypothetical protein